MARLGRAYPAPLIRPNRIPVATVAPTYDTGSDNAYTTQSSGSAMTFTVSPLAKDYIAPGAIAAASTTMAPGSATAAVTCGSTTLTPLGYVLNNNAASSGWQWVWGGFIPTGGSQTGSITLE